MSEKILSIGDALCEFEILIEELRKEVVLYNKRISATEETWLRNKVYLNGKIILIEKLETIKVTIETLKYHDQWLQIQRTTEHLQKQDRELSAVNIFFPLRKKFDYNHIAFIDLSI